LRRSGISQGGAFVQTEDIKMYKMQTKFGWRYFENQKYRVKNKKRITVFIGMIIVSIFIMICAGCGGYHDLTKGSVDPDVQHFVDQIKEYALQYNAQSFYKRMEYIDVMYSDSEKGQELVASLDSPELGIWIAKAFNRENGSYRAIVIYRELFSDQTETEKLITLLHEYYHAVSEDCDEKQHINDTVFVVDPSALDQMYPEIKEMSLSIMHFQPTIGSIFWDKYKDYYLRQLFEMRLDRTWKEE
jgi:hypothetical protein